MHIIVITSVESSSGKTVLTTSLAEAAVSESYRTVILDLSGNAAGFDQIYKLSKEPVRARRKVVLNEEIPFSLQAYPSVSVLRPGPAEERLDLISDLALLLDGLKSEVDLLIAELSHDLSAAHWRQLVEIADTAIMVTGCNRGAINGIKNLLGNYGAVPVNKWTVIVNQCQGVIPYYSPHQVIRSLNGHPDIAHIMSVPFYPGLQWRSPATIRPGEPFLAQLLWMTLSMENGGRGAEFIDRYAGTCESRLKPIKDELPDSEGEINPLQEEAPAPEESGGCPASDIQIQEQAEQAGVTKVHHMSESSGRAWRTPAFKGKWLLRPSLKRSRISSRLFRSRQQGIILAGRFVRARFSDPVAMMDRYPLDKLDAIIMPASMGFSAIKQHRRDRRGRTIVLLVLKGNSQHIALGADQVAPSLNPGLVQSISSYARRLRELWSSVERDPLTHCYKREFFEAWLKEQERHDRIFAIVFIDPDRFKSINDNYGHDAGDSVLVQFGDFLCINSRNCDLVTRWGGDEFIVAMPDTSAAEAWKYMDRLREKWSARELLLPGGQRIHSTFSAGVADNMSDCNVVKRADELLYEAKRGGRNQIRFKAAVRVAVFGSIPVDYLKERGIECCHDPGEAVCIVCTAGELVAGFRHKPIFILGSGGAGDWAARRIRPDGQFFSSLDKLADAVAAYLRGQTKPISQSEPPEAGDACSTTIPHFAGNKEECVSAALSGSSVCYSLPLHEALFVVCPSRPGLAGELAARLALNVEKAALVCATSESRAAMELKIPADQLILTDWRLPRGRAPLDWSGLKVWPVDPYKYLDHKNYTDVQNLVDQIKPWFDLVVVDCGSSLALCSSIAGRHRILIIRTESDSADMAAGSWLQQNQHDGVIVMAPSEIPEIIETRDGFAIVKGGIIVPIRSHT